MTSSIDGTQVLHANYILKELHPKQRMTYDVHKYYGPWGNESVIERHKRRNFIIAVATSVVITVATLALSVFSLMSYIMKNPNWQVPNTSYPALSNNPTMLNPVAATLGIVISAFAGLIIGTGQGLGITELTNYILDRNTVEPLREISKQIASKDDMQLLEAEHLVPLVKRCDTRAQEWLIKTMNFEQLTHARGALSTKTFKKLIEPVNQTAHHRWKLILEFGNLSVEKKLEALKKEGLLKVELSKQPEMAPFIRQECYKISEQEARFQAIQALDLAEGLINESDKHIVLTFQPDIKRSYPVSWVKSQSTWLNDRVDFYEKDGITDKLSSELLDCLDIIQGIKQLPDDLDALIKLAKTADYYIVPEITTMFGNALLKKAQNNKISKVDFFTLIVKNVPNEARYNTIQNKAIQLSEYNKIHTVDEFKRLWKISENWNDMRTMCTTFFTNTLLYYGQWYRQAYELADELDCPKLKELCSIKLSEASPAYKEDVKISYGISDMPHEVLIWIK